MATYEVVAPDGQKYRVNAPEGATQDDAIKYVQTQFYSTKEVEMPAKKEGFGEALTREVKDIPRQLGLTARYGMEGVGGTLDMLASPFRAGLNAVLPDSMQIRGNTGEALANRAGLPTPQTTIERISAEPAKMLAGGAGMLSGARAASALPGVAGKVSGMLAANPAQQFQAATGAGLAGGYTKETGGDPLAQTLAAVAGGVAAPVGVAAMKSIPQAAKSALEFLAPGIASKPQNIDQIDITIQNILKPSGISISDLSASVRNQLREDVAKAMKTGGSLDESALSRLADYRMVGATPTRATITLDPADITRQKNAAKFGINSADPKLQQLGQIENANNRAIIAKLNEMGAGGNQDRYGAAEKIMSSLLSKDAAAKARIDAAYKAAKEAAGRDIPLDGESFVLDAYARLAQNNKGAFLSPEVAKLLETIRVGTQQFGGKTYDAPFTVDAIDNLKSILSKETMKGGNTASAAKIVRMALDDVSPVANGRSVSGNQIVVPDSLKMAQTKANELSENALRLFDKARATNKEWMTIVDRVPALQAVRDGVEPDKFVQQFIIGDGSKASVMSTAQLKSLIKGSEPAMQAVRGQIMAHLKEKALNGASDEVGNVSQSGLNRALASIGDRKLNLFFSPDEVAQIKALARVASYEQVQPRGSAVNNSNTTGAALAAIFDKIASSKIIGKIPLAPQAAGNVSASITSRNALNVPAAVTIPQQGVGVSPYILPAMGLLAE